MSNGKRKLKTTTREEASTGTGTIHIELFHKIATKVSLILANEVQNNVPVRSSSSGSTQSVHPRGIKDAVSCPTLTSGSTRTVSFASSIETMSMKRFKSTCKNK